MLWSLLVSNAFSSFLLYFRYCRMSQEIFPIQLQRRRKAIFVERSCSVLINTRRHKRDKKNGFAIPGVSQEGKVLVSLILGLHKS